MSRRARTREQMRQEDRMAGLYFSAIGSLILLWAALWDSVLRVLEGMG